MDSNLANISLFSLDDGASLLQQVAALLSVNPGRHEERLFADGEHKIRPLESVRGRDVYIVQSIYSSGGLSVNDKLVQLLFFVGALRDAGAARINVIAPYLGYTRKDRRTESRDPVSLRYLAQLLETLGIDCIATVDVHNQAAFENAFRCPSLHLSAQQLLIGELLPRLVNRPVTVASPDVGGIKRAERFRAELYLRLGHPIASAFVEKYRHRGEIRGDFVGGEIRDQVVVIVDDLIAGGATVQRAAEAFMAKGASAVYAIASHAIFTADAEARLADVALSNIFVSNSVTVELPAALHDKLTVVGIAPLIAEAIRHLHAGA